MVYGVVEMGVQSAKMKRFDYVEKCCQWGVDGCQMVGEKVKVVFK
jgi:hypothetical protein